MHQRFMTRRQLTKRIAHFTLPQRSFTSFKCRCWKSKIESIKLEHFNYSFANIYETILIYKKKKLIHANKIERCQLHFPDITGSLCITQCTAALIATRRKMIAYLRIRVVPRGRQFSDTVPEIVDYIF